MNIENVSDLPDRPDAKALADNLEKEGLTYVLVVADAKGGTEQMLANAPPEYAMLMLRRAYAAAKAGAEIDHDMPEPQGTA